MKLPGKMEGHFHCIDVEFKKEAEKSEKEEVKPKPKPDDCTNKCKTDCCEQDQCYSQPSVDVHVKVSLSGLQGLHSNCSSAHKCSLSFDLKY